MTIKEARLAAGLTQAAMSERLMISKRNIENWEAGKNICPAWAEALIIAELNRIFVENIGGTVMKKVRISVVTEDCTASKAQVFNEYYFDFDAAVAAARDSYNRLTDHDKAAREALYVQEVEVEIPDEYEVRSAEQLARDLTLGDIESDDFDPCCGVFKRIIRESGDLRAQDQELEMDEYEFEQALKNFEDCVEFMDDEIREEIHAEGECDTNESFLREYARRHARKYNEAFRFN